MPATIISHTKKRKRPIFKPFTRREKKSAGGEKEKEGNKYQVRAPASTQRRFPLGRGEQASWRARRQEGNAMESTRSNASYRFAELT